MAKMVMTAIGSAGDVHPLLGIARALSMRGHDVAFCTHPPFEPAVRHCGITFAPLGTAAEYEAAMADEALWNPRTSLRALWRAIAPILRPHYDALRRLVDDETVLVGTLWAFSARLMQETRRTRYVSVQVSPSTLLSAIAPPVHKRMTIPQHWPLWVKSLLLNRIERWVLDRVCGPELNAFRAELGLPPVTHILGRWLHSTDAVLCLFPDWFAKPQRDWPATFLQSGFPLFGDVADRLDDPDLEAMLASGEPPVVFTPGSTNVDRPAYARLVADVLRSTGARGILLMPTEQHVGSDRLLVRNFVPLRALLPRCRALVHHGGIGTAALAYEAGVPQVVTPFAHDQFDNARRIVQSGCGVSVDGPLESGSLSDALARALRDAKYAACGARARARMAAAPDGCGVAADFIERFIPGRDAPVARGVAAMNE